MPSWPKHFPNLYRQAWRHDISTIFPLVCRVMLLMKLSLTKNPRPPNTRMLWWVQNRHGHVAEELEKWLSLSWWIHSGDSAVQCWLSSSCRNLALLFGCEALRRKCRRVTLTCQQLNETLLVVDIYFPPFLLPLDCLIDCLPHLRSSTCRGFYWIFPDDRLVWY